MSGNLFKTGAQWLNDRLTESARVWVTVRRGSESIRISALIGASVHEGENVSGGMVTWRSVDFIVTAADYRFGGAQSDPQRNDIIQSDHTGVLRNYEVINPTGEDHWSNSDEFALAIRVHTQVITVNG